MLLCFKKDRCIALFFKAALILTMLSNIIGYYFISTRALPEFLGIVSIALYFLLNKSLKADRQNFRWAMFTLLSILCLIAMYGRSLGEVSGIGKESYRVAIIPFICFSFSLNRKSIAAKEITAFALLLIKIIAVYTIWELLYLNFFSPGNFSGHPLSSAIKNYYGGMRGQYFNYVWDYGIPYYRPFGIWLQPQKSAFAFPLGILLLTVLRDKNFPNDKILLTSFWVIVFISACIMSGGKTAILASVIIYLTGILQKGIIKRAILLFLIVLGVAITVSRFEQTYLTIKQDMEAFSSLPIGNLLFGLGFPSAQKLHSFGFAVESFIIRFIAGAGVIIAMLIFSCWIMLTTLWRKNNRRFCLWGILIFFMVLHYSVLSVHFVIAFISVAMVASDIKVQASTNGMPPDFRMRFPKSSFVS